MLPALLPLWLLPQYWRRLRDQFALGEPDLRPGWPPVDVETTGGLAVDAARPSEASGPTAIEEAIRSREFLRPLAWAQIGFIERLVLAWLSSRERLVLEFMLTPDPRCTHRFWRLLRFAGVGAALCLVPSGWLRGAGGFLIAAATGLGTVVLLLESWRGFAAGYSGGMNVPTCALHPLSFREIHRIICKVALVRSGILSAVVVLAGGFLGWRFSESAARGIDLALRGVVLCMAVLPVLMLWHFSQVTNDTSQMRLPASALFLILILAQVGFGIATFFVEWRSALLICVPGLALLSGGLFLLYRRAWEHG